MSRFVSIIFAGAALVAASMATTAGDAKAAVIGGFTNEIGDTQAIQAISFKKHHFKGHRFKKHGFKGHKFKRHGFKGHGFKKHGFKRHGFRGHKRFLRGNHFFGRKKFSGGGKFFFGHGHHRGFHR